MIDSIFSMHYQEENFSGVVQFFYPRESQTLERKIH